MPVSVLPLGTPSADDLVDVVDLVRSLGYAVDEALLSARLDRLTAEAGHETWVVRDESGRVTAVAGAHLLWAYNSDQPTAQLLLLVVKPGARREGVGSQLLTHFEAWARARGASTLTAVSAAAPETAHRFYQRRGYHESGLRYSKLG